MTENLIAITTYGRGTHRELGLTDDEFAEIVSIIGRPPTDLELAMFSVMWSEHCSYKSSRKHLARLPTEGPQVLVGPGENAGVVDVGDDIAVALRIESHNHPSFVEPYQGAATGVGGILRDIFTMGARPIALMDPLFLGPLDDAHSRYLFDGIVRGIAGYGNAVGVPTVGGQITFDPTYRRNPLVNVFCLGLLRQDRLVMGSAKGVGNLAVLLGSATGRDGIGGVSVLASAGFGAEATTKRPSVQVGDPYEEKRLIEACLLLLEEKLVVGIQDLGGAGLACATSETAARAGLGMDVDVDAVHRREPNMTAVEVMTSESQERMLAIVEPSSLERVEQICRRFEVTCSVIGRVTAPGADGVGRLRILTADTPSLLADIPASALTDGAPRYDRPIHQPDEFAAELASDAARLDPPDSCADDLLSLLSDPAFIYRQYDHQLFLNTVFGPGDADATLLKLSAPGIAYTGKAIALSVDANPRWCRVDPRAGTEAIVAECTLNISCVGARPLALVNCLNFGDPTHPEVMWQLSSAIDGMASACRGLEVPVVGGNVSLYNSSEGTDITPTPVVGVVGLVDQLKRRPPSLHWRDGDTLVLVGKRSTALSGSRWAAELHGHELGAIAPVELTEHRKLCEFVQQVVVNECQRANDEELVISAVHDISDGGLGVALAECALASQIGARVDLALTFAELFSEASSRVVLATNDPTEVLENARQKDVSCAVLGKVGGDRLIVSELVDLGLDELGAAAVQSIGAQMSEVVRG